MMKTQFIKSTIAILIIGFFSNVLLFAQPLTQTIRGKIVDQDTKVPMIGANIIILATNPIIGAATDVDGKFRIEKVPLGRLNLKVTCMGYEDRIISNILVGSGKEIVLNLEILESVLNLEAVTVSAKKHKAETRNKMSTVSSKTFSVEETNRYSGSLNDPARMVSSFAGVAGDAMGNNDIVVRGNSPRGILWRLEGVEIPNPNHFANEGSTGGPVNTLNASVLSNSDFFTGAFAPEYGNALSGVFDVYYRTGNNEKREYSFSAGIIGVDFTAEGPVKKGYGGSYLINYRYSSIDLLTMTGLLDFGGVPKYQDAALKIELPTKKAGKFSIFGLGGDSHIHESDTDEETDITYSDGDFGANLGVIGVNHSYIINDKTFLKTSLSATSSKNGYKGETLWDDNEMHEYFEDFYRENKLRAASTLNKKLNSKNKLQVGVIYTNMSYNMYGEEDLGAAGFMTSFIDIEGNTGLMQGFGSWKCRLSQDLTLVSGLHYTQFMLNNTSSIEPRLGLKWQFTSKQSLSAGYGRHSRLESVSTYLATIDYESVNASQKNKDLELTKATHYVLGYDNQFNENLHLRLEVYYQDLYDIPVENDVNSSFSISNYSMGYTNTELVNKGTGRNYGIEMTLERFFSNNFYYLFTGSLYEAKFTAMDGIERDSRYNANYAANFIIGKEFSVGKKSKNKTMGINSRVTFLGANMYTPLDLQASIDAGTTVFDKTQEFSLKGEDIFFLNIGFTIRKEKAKSSRELLFDIRNVTNNQAFILEYYNARAQEVEQAKQLPFIPNIAYIVKF